MNNYETVFILTPVLSDAQMKEAVDKFKKLLQEQGAEIVNEENWGLRKLAYPIDKKTAGIYTFLEFKASPEVVDKLEINFRRDERIIRFLTIRQDKFALEYAEKRRKKGSNKQETKVEEPAPVKVAKVEPVAEVVVAAPVAEIVVETPAAEIVVEAPVVEVIEEVPVVEVVESEKKED